MGGHTANASFEDPTLLDEWFKGGPPKRRSYWTRRALRTRKELIRKCRGKGKSWGIYTSSNRRVAGPFPTLKAAKVAYLLRIAAS